MTQRRLIPLLILCSAALCSGPLEAAGDMQFFVGRKQLDQDDWRGSEEQPEIGLVNTFGPGRWPVALALDVLLSTEEISISGLPGGYEQWTAELGVGVRKIWGRGRIRPFLGGGAAMVWGGRELFDLSDFRVADESDNGLGYWIDGGVFLRFGRHFNFGIEARLSRAEINLDGTVQAGGDHIGLLFGGGW